MNTYKMNETFDAEMVLFWDCDTARFAFEDNFEVLEYSGYRKTGIYYMLDYESKPPFDCSDLVDCGNCNWRDFRAAVIEHFNSVREAIQYKQEQAGLGRDWKHAWNTLAGDYDIRQWIDGYFDSFPTMSKPLFGWMQCNGYSQGDSCAVVYDVKHKPNRDYVCNLLYDSPLYCRVEWEGGEAYLSDYLDNPYEYDRDELLSYAARQSGMPEDVYTWLEKTLPEDASDVKFI